MNPTLLRITKCLLALALWAGSSSLAGAGTITLDALDSGHYTRSTTLGVSTFTHESADKGYVSSVTAVVPTSNSNSRNYFVFDLSGVTDEVVGARLLLFNPPGGYFGPDSGFAFNLWEVTTPVDVLVASQVGGVGSVAEGVFTDLGGGTSYGSVLVSPSDNDRVVAIDLNNAALSALNAARGEQFALGGNVALGFALISIFSGTGAGDTRQLVLTTQPVGVIPEPSTGLLLAVGVPGLVGYAWRSRKGGVRP